MVEVAYVGWSVSVQYPLDPHPFIREYIHDFSQMCHYCDIDDRKEREETVGLTTTPSNPTHPTHSKEIAGIHWLNPAAIHLLRLVILHQAWTLL